MESIIFDEAEKVAGPGSFLGTGWLIIRIWYIVNNKNNSLFILIVNVLCSKRDLETTLRVNN